MTTTEYQSSLTWIIITLSLVQETERRMDLCCDTDSLPLSIAQNMFQHFASLLIISSTGGVLIILLTWVRYTLEHNIR